MNNIIPLVSIRLVNKGVSVLVMHIIRTMHAS